LGNLVGFPSAALGTRHSVTVHIGPNEGDIGFILATTVALAEKIFFMLVAIQRPGFGWLVALGTTGPGSGVVLVGHRVGLQLRRGRTSCVEKAKSMKAAIAVTNRKKNQACISYTLDSSWVVAFILG